MREGEDPSASMREDGCAQPQTALGSYSVRVAGPLAPALAQERYSTLMSWRSREVEGGAIEDARVPVLPDEPCNHEYVRGDPLPMRCRSHECRIVPPVQEADTGSWGKGLRVAPSEAGMPNLT